jgi:hypothetical protein
MPLFDKPTMVCGMDVFHSTALGKKSVYALTASVNASATKYFSPARFRRKWVSSTVTTSRLEWARLLKLSRRSMASIPSRSSSTGMELVKAKSWESSS